MRLDIDILQKNCGISGRGIAGHYSEFFCLINVAYRAMAHFYGLMANVYLYL